MADDPEVLALLEDMVAKFDRWLEQERLRESRKSLSVDVEWIESEQTWCATASITHGRYQQMAVEKGATRGEALARLATKVINHDLRQSGRWASGPALGDQGPGA